MQGAQEIPRIHATRAPKTARALCSAADEAEWETLAEPAAKADEAPKTDEAPKN